MGLAGDLEQFLVKAGPRMGHEEREQFGLNLLLQAVLGLKEIHAMNVMHRDIKLKNLLYFQNGLVDSSDQDQRLRDFSRLRRL